MSTGHLLGCEKLCGYTFFFDIKKILMKNGTVACRHPLISSFKLSNLLVQRELSSVLENKFTLKAGSIAALTKSTDK